MENQLNSGSLDTLKPNDVLLVQARKVANGKIQIEVAELIEKDNKLPDVLNLINESDNRFSNGGARRHWATAEQVDSTKYFGIDFMDTANWYMGTSKSGISVELLDLNVLNPVVNDQRCRIIITETITPTDWQADNIEKSAKRKGKDGEFMTHDSNYIFVNSRLVLTNENTKNEHTFLDLDKISMQTGEKQPFGKMISNYADNLVEDIQL